MVIADLYAPRGAPAAALEAATSAAQLPGIAAVARFGERRPLAAGWRPWLAQWSGRTELAAVAPAWIAAARAGVAAAGGGCRGVRRRLCARPRRGRHAPGGAALRRLPAEHARPGHGGER